MRIDWVDELKGFLLIIICMGHMHINNNIISTGLSMSTAYSVSTFFFISGLLTKSNSLSNIGGYIYHKSKTLLLPYFTLSLIFTFLDPRLYDISLLKFDPIVSLVYFPNIIITNVFSSSTDYLKNEFCWIFLAGRSTPSTMPMWFVLTLFFASSLFCLVFNIAKNKRICIAVFASFALIAGWFLSNKNILLLLNFSSVITALFFYSLGYLSKPMIAIIENMNSIWLVLCSTTLMLLYFIGININGGVHLISNSLGVSLSGYLMSTCCGIALLINVFVLLSRIKIKIIKGLKGILRNIARNGIVVLAVHYWLLRICFEFIDRDYIVEGVHFVSIKSILFVIVGTILLIPIFRNKLYWLIGTKKLTIKESLNIT